MEQTEKKESREVLFGRILATMEFIMERDDRSTSNFHEAFLKHPASTYAAYYPRLAKEGLICHIVERELIQNTSKLDREEFNDTPLKNDWLHAYSKQKLMLTKVFEIRDLRKKTGLSQEAFGKLCGDVPVRTIQNWESGASLPASYVVNLIKEKVNTEISQNEKAGKVRT